MTAVDNGEDIAGDEVVGFGVELLEEARAVQFDPTTTVFFLAGGCFSDSAPRSILGIVGGLNAGVVVAGRIPSGLFHVGLGAGAAVKLCEAGGGVDGGNEAEDNRRRF